MKTDRASAVEQTLIRDRFRCVYCQSGKDLTAHHIIERSLWDTPDQGYFLDNLVTVCYSCHWLAETGFLIPRRLREIAGITKVVVPDHLYADTEYTKWGSPIEGGLVHRGELSWDGGDYMTDYVKYPRTYHLPWSHPSKGDRTLAKIPDVWYNEDVVVTDKIDGQNITMYSDYIHSRAIVGANIDSWTKNMWSQMAHNIPEGWRVCGDSVAVPHTIDYERDFWLHSVWDGEWALSWPETVEWAKLLDLTPVPVVYQGSYEQFERFRFQTEATVDEGYVIRPLGSFRFKDFRKVVGKWVSAEFQQRRIEKMYG